MAKILIVEDDETLVKMYARKLMHEGFEVMAAYSGNEGLLAVKQERPDLILLDIMMPAVDGFEVIRQIRSDAATKDIPIVILTNLGTSEIFYTEAKRLGVEHYLVKYKTSTQEVIKVIKEELNK